MPCPVHHAVISIVADACRWMQRAKINSRFILAVSACHQFCWNPCFDLTGTPQTVCAQRAPAVLVVTPGLSTSPPPAARLKPGIRIKSRGCSKCARNHGDLQLIDTLFSPAEVACAESLAL